MPKQAVAYLENEFNRQWDRFGHATKYVASDWTITKFTLPSYTGDRGPGYGNSMFDLKDDMRDSYILCSIIPMDPIPSIPSTVKEWEANTNEDWEEYCQL